ncbi:MAG: DUF2812 domain-containing protein [Clostridia bacterium]|nr:DUF2812 domain-containing protein [Clostridia bacterium]
MIRFHFTFNKENMAAWLDEMDRHGYKLRRTAAGFCIFDPVAPGTYDYQIDYAGGGALDPAYRSLMADLGIEIVCRWGPWVVLRRMASEGPFMLYTDAASRLEHLKKVRSFFALMACLELFAVTLLASLALPDRQWPLLVVAGLGLAAAAAMIARAKNIQAEITALDPNSSAGAPEPLPRVLIALGCVCILISYVLQEASISDAAAFLRGAGIGLLLVSIFLLFRRRLRA